MLQIEEESREEVWSEDFLAGLLRQPSPDRAPRYLKAEIMEVVESQSPPIQPILTKRQWAVLGVVTVALLVLGWQLSEFGTANNPTAMPLADALGDWLVGIPTVVFWSLLVFTLLQGLELLLRRRSVQNKERVR